MNVEKYNELIGRIEIDSITLGKAQVERQWTSSSQPGQATADIKVAVDEPVVIGNELWVKARFGVETRTVEPDEAEEQPLFTLDFVLEARYSISTLAESCEATYLADAEEELRYFSEHNLPINVWPYAREFISSISVRMGFPALVIGVYRASANQ